MASLSGIACGGAGKGTKTTDAPVVTMQPPPASKTTATLVGGLCTENGCTCRDPQAAGDGGVGVTDVAGRKRFEIHLGPSQHQLWATIDGDVLYKSAEHADACFYVDLPSGEHPMTMRASESSGVQAAISVSEFGPKASSWYHTFSFTCGSPGVCDRVELDEQRQSFEQVAHGQYDSCGSTKIKGLGWNFGSPPDGAHPSDLQVDFRLSIYKFTPVTASGSPGCGHGSREKPAAPETTP